MQTMRFLPFILWPQGIFLSGAYLGSAFGRRGLVSGPAIFHYEAKIRLFIDGHRQKGYSQFRFLMRSLVSSARRAFS
jgi:hypothetical protein